VVVSTHTKLPWLHLSAAVRACSAFHVELKRGDVRDKKSIFRTLSAKRTASNKDEENGLRQSRKEAEDELVRADRALSNHEKSILASSPRSSVRRLQPLRRSTSQMEESDGSLKIVKMKAPVKAGEWLLMDVATDTVYKTGGNVFKKLYDMTHPIEIIDQGDAKHELSSEQMTPSQLQWMKAQAAKASEHNRTLDEKNQESAGNIHKDERFHLYKPKDTRTVLIMQTQWINKLNEHFAKQGQPENDAVLKFVLEKVRNGKWKETEITKIGVFARRLGETEETTEVTRSHRDWKAINSLRFLWKPHPVHHKDFPVDNFVVVPGDAMDIKNNPQGSPASVTEIANQSLMNNYMVIERKRVHDLQSDEHLEAEHRAALEAEKKRLDDEGIKEDFFVNFYPRNANEPPTSETGQQHSRAHRRPSWSKGHAFTQETHVQ